MVPRSRRRSSGNKGWNRPSAWKAKITVFSLKEKGKNPRSRLFFFFSKCVRGGQGLIPDRRGVLRGGSSSLRERQARKVASRVDKAR